MLEESAEAMLNAVLLRHQTNAMPQLQGGEKRKREDEIESEAVDDDVGQSRVVSNGKRTRAQGEN
jgi:hypothetical protein